MVAAFGVPDVNIVRGPWSRLALEAPSRRTKQTRSRPQSRERVSPPPCAAPRTPAGPREPPGNRGAASRLAALPADYGHGPDRGRDLAGKQRSDRTLLSLFVSVRSHIVFAL